jgi:tRNA1Val (adenine37-N6)-methyltransferase
MTDAARQQFPRGLMQPEGGYRFSMDSLLLSCFCHLPNRAVGADLGAGCGVVGLGLLLRGQRENADWGVTGVELDPDAVCSAQDNARLLGLGDRFAVREADVREFVRREPDRALAQTLDFVVANPPYRDPGSGRVSHGEQRGNARFEQQASFADFCACAARLLRGRGRFFVVHLAERLPDLLQDMRSAGLEPKRMRLVHSRIHEPARMVLLEGVRDARPGLVAEAPLVVYEGQGQATAMTPQALDFCPFLQCNAGTRA